MKAQLTHSIISAKLRTGMFIIVNEHLGFVSQLNSEEATVSYYYENQKMVALGKKTMSREEFEKNYTDKVIKLIAIVDNNPVSINHQNYKKLFAPMLTFPKGGKESYITTFLRTNEWPTPIIGEIVPVYSMLAKDDIVTVVSLEVVDKLCLYDVEKRLVKIISKKQGSKYEVSLVHDMTITAMISRSDVFKDEKDKYNLFMVSDFDLKALVNSGEAKSVEAKAKVVRKDVNSLNVNAFNRLHKSDWCATYDKLKDNDNYQWLAVNSETKQILPISIPITNVPKFQFSGMDNDYWIPGTVKMQENPTADLKNFVPFREGLPIVGEVISQTISGTQFTYFLLDNFKQNSINRFIFKHRDITEERRNDLTLKKLPKL